ncbi:MAG: lysophospholipid acyltransferase family protein [bacterium]|nr:lysophospholipid acyltransferase family protein [bacterium]
MKLILFPCRVIHMLFVWLVVVFAFVSHALITLPLLPLVWPKRSEFSFWVAKFFLRLVLLACGVRLTVTGVEHFPEKGGAIVMSNHQSMMDVLVMLIATPRYYRFIAKKEIQYTPFVGLAMVVQRHYFIKRTNAREAVRIMTEVKADAALGIPIMMYPEGTRSEDGALGEFKRGGFQIAVETGLPVVPCTLIGARQVLPKKKLFPKPGHIYVHFSQARLPDKVAPDNRMAVKTASDNLLNVVRGDILEQQASFALNP